MSRFVLIDIIIRRYWNFVKVKVINKIDQILQKLFFLRYSHNDLLITLEFRLLYFFSCSNSWCLVIGKGLHRQSSMERILWILQIYIIFNTSKFQEFFFFTYFKFIYLILAWSYPPTFSTCLHFLLLFTIILH